MGEVILVVEDDPDMRACVAEVLADEGYEVLVAREGSEALRILREASQRPSLILLDVMMPGMNGLAFREEQLRDQRLADIRVIIFSAADRVDPAFGDIERLPKPIEIDALVQAIEAPLNPPRA